MTASACCRACIQLTALTPPPAPARRGGRGLTSARAASCRGRTLALAVQVHKGLELVALEQGVLVAQAAVQDPGQGPADGAGDPHEHAREGRKRGANGYAVPAGGGGVGERGGGSQGFAGVAVTAATTGKVLFGLNRVAPRAVRLVAARPGMGAVPRAAPAHLEHTAWGRISPKIRMAVVASRMALMGSTSRSKKIWVRGIQPRGGRGSGLGQVMVAGRGC